MKRLIIGCGYLGKRVAKRWLEQGDEVHVLTRSAEHAKQFGEQGLHPIQGDVTASDTLANLPSVDTLFWAVGWDRQSGHSMHDVYVTGLRHVICELARRCPRFITVSSTSVYGQAAGEWVDEASECAPQSPNGQTCLQAEQLLNTELQRLPAGQRPSWTVMRLSGIYGPGRLLSRIATLKSGAPLSGNPDAWLNLIHVDDAANAVVLAANRPGAPNSLLISDHEPIPRRFYYSLLAELVDAPAPRFAEPETLAGESSGLNKRCQSMNARTLLSWDLQFPTIREGLPHAVQQTEII